MVHITVMRIMIPDYFRLKGRCCEETTTSKNINVCRNGQSARNAARVTANNENQGHFFIETTGAQENGDTGIETSVSVWRSEPKRTPRR